MYSFDEKGNVNVSVLGQDYFGCGGYIDICHGAKKILFVGSFTAKGLELSQNQNGLRIDSEGIIQKAVKSVDEITYSPKMQSENAQEILIITERCVFRIDNNRITLIEIAPGIDLKNDILDLMAFEPIIHDRLKA